MTARTEHQNLVVKYKGDTYLLCDNRCYDIYKCLEDVGIKVLERGFRTLDYFKDKSFIELANKYRPTKTYYNTYPVWSDYAEIYVKHTTHENVIICGDIDGIEDGILISYKPSKDCPDCDNHRLYQMLERDYGLEFKIVYDYDIMKSNKEKHYD